MTPSARSLRVVVAEDEVRGRGARARRRRHGPRAAPGRTDEGIRFAAGLRGSARATAVLVLCRRFVPAWSRTLFVDGAAGRGCLLKELGVSDLPAVSRRVAAVLSYLGANGHPNGMR